MISIIIASRNEGDHINSTISAIKSTCDIEHEIIVVDDCSEKPIKNKDAIVIRNKIPIGVHRSINIGSKKAKYPFMAIFNARMRFPTKKWASIMVGHMMKNKKTLFCTRGGVLTFENTEKATGYRYGADIILNYSENDIYESFSPVWKKEDKKNDIYEIPCVLGANYFMPTSLFRYFGGFRLLDGYGGLCAYLSLMVWKIGGRVMIAKDVTISNIYYGKGQEKPYPIDKCDYYWNRLVTGFIFLDWKDAENIMYGYSDNKCFEMLKNKLIHNIEEIISVRKFLAVNGKYDINHLIKK